MSGGKDEGRARGFIDRAIDYLSGAALFLALGLVAFAAGVRVWSQIDKSPPSLSSLDPLRRVAAAEAAAKRYGGDGP